MNESGGEVRGAGGTGWGGGGGGANAGRWRRRDMSLIVEQRYLLAGEAVLDSRTDWRRSRTRWNRPATYVPLLPAPCVSSALWSVCTAVLPPHWTVSNVRCYVWQRRMLHDMIITRSMRKLTWSKTRLRLTAGALFATSLRNGFPYVCLKIYRIDFSTMFVL